MGATEHMGYIRDNAFLIYQTSLIFTIELLDGPLGSGSVRCATAGLAILGIHPFSVAACFALVGERDRFGVAHITLYAMLAIGLAFLAANFTRSRIACFIVAGCVIDFSLGVFLQARVEHLENTAQQAAFPRILVGKVRMDLAPAGPDALSRTAGNNWFRKHQYALATTWLASLARSHPGGERYHPGRRRSVTRCRKSCARTRRSGADGIEETAARSSSSAITSPTATEQTAVGKSAVWPGVENARMRCAYVQTSVKSLLVAFPKRKGSEACMKMIL